MDTFWGELRQRKVIRVAIAYAVGAWVLLQIDYTDAPILELPTWAPKLILVLLVVGFIRALIFACAYVAQRPGCGHHERCSCEAGYERFQF